jgi:hypothetical protein
MTPTGHDFEHVTIVVRPVDAESFYSAREKWVCLDLIKDVEGPVPVVRVLAEVKVNCAKDATESDIAMEGRHE